MKEYSESTQEAEFTVAITSSYNDNVGREQGCYASYYEATAAAAVLTRTLNLETLNTRSTPDRVIIHSFYKH